MKQRGRKSAAGLAVATQGAVSVREAPPGDLTEIQRLYWLEITNALPADWFSPENKALLVEYVRTLSTLAFMNAQIDAFEAKNPDEIDVRNYLELVKRRESLARVQLSQATKMRLTQQSRYRADRAAVLTEKPDGQGASKPWQFEG